MASRKQKKREKDLEWGIAPNGGLEFAEQLLELRDSKGFDPISDVVLVSIDLEVSKYDKGKPGSPPIREFGIATFDTRHLKPTSRSLPNSSISTKQVSTCHASKDFIYCDATDFKECVFAETHLAKQGNLHKIIKKCLRIEDSSSPNSRTLRNIVIVGHSIKEDLKTLKRHGIVVHEIAPVVAILDTYRITWNLLGPHTNSNSTTFMTGFALWALLEELMIPHEKWDLHNAGNDATFTLHALLMLAIKSSRSRELNVVESQNLERLRALAQFELYERERWKPTRKGPNASNGFYYRNSSEQTGSTT
ncbi:uncharacterized protein BP5553_09590 [Venustampulla echinocandica]|uniref:Gfd2/YDR514C-like C-terminal domain-containing protein n=1 Tax=Venustampulla echinocandica TaxID=2656787 RepID=A0A370TBE9_9HELO|nr:uncharacterized protein BP5553_09590 [Venustampulla echinocandica]RDL31381.1 hypothetical protein BP5553_09590 [Venustampulla echinocandica]